MGAENTLSSHQKLLQKLLMNMEIRLILEKVPMSHTDSKVLIPVFPRNSSGLSLSLRLLSLTCKISAI